MTPEDGEVLMVLVETQLVDDRKDQQGDSKLDHEKQYGWKMLVMLALSHYFYGTRKSSPIIIREYRPARI